MRYLFPISLALVLLPLSSAVNPLVRKGKFLYDSTTQARFMIKGLAYQPPAPIAATTAAQAAAGGFPEPDSYFDALDDVTACTRDMANFQTLGINAVRVYSINPYADHSGCMKLFNDNGIYVIADLGLPLNGSIDRAAPAWHVGLLYQYIAVIDNLAQYPNLLAVGVGNEVSTLANNTAAMTFVKAAARDIKAYIKSKNLPTLVAYSSSDGAQWRQDLAAYMTCGDESTTVDIMGLNQYRWCGDSSYAASGYQTLTTEFDKYPVVTYFSEYGCVTQERVWSDVPVMFSAPMSNTWSGGIAFEYFQDTLNYGLLANNLTTRDQARVVTNADFTRLATQYTAANIPNTPAFSSASQLAYPTCATPDGVNFAASLTLPVTPDESVCQCLTVNALPCTVRKTATPAVVGELLDYTCSLLGQNGLSCDDIASNGATGVYGPISFCSPAEKLSYIMSLWFSHENNDPAACSFSNNGTVNRRAPTTSDGVQSAISTCISNGAGNKTNGIFAPSIVPVLIPSGSSSTRPDGDSVSGAAALIMSFSAMIGLIVVGAAMVV